MVLAGIQSCRQCHLPRGGGDVAGLPLVAPRRAASKGEGRSFTMTDDKGAFGRRGLFLLTVASLCSITLLSGCGFRQLVGLDKTGPDEFAVESRAPLTIPPDFELRPPAPGAARPQEVTAAQRARKAIDTAGPGEAGTQASGGRRQPGRATRPAATPHKPQAGGQDTTGKPRVHSDRL